MADIHGCQVVYHFLKWFRTDLQRGSIYRELIDEVNDLWTRDIRANEARRWFCCSVVVNRLYAHLRRQAARPLSDFLDIGKHGPFDYDEAARALRATAEYYGVELAEYAMGTAQRDAMQLMDDDNRQQNSQVRRALHLVEAAKREDTQAVGREFYTFMYHDLRDLDGLLEVAKTLIEVRDVESA